MSCNLNLPSDCFLNKYLFINFFKMLPAWVWKVLLGYIFLFICLVSSLCLSIARVSHILIQKIPHHFLKIFSVTILLFPEEFSSFCRKSSSNEWIFVITLSQEFFPVKEMFSLSARHSWAQVSAFVRKIPSCDRAFRGYPKITLVQFGPPSPPVS